MTKETYQAHLTRVEEELTLAEVNSYEAKIDDFDIEGTLALTKHLVTLSAGRGSRLGWSSRSAFSRSSPRKVAASPGKVFEHP